MDELSSAPVPLAGSERASMALRMFEFFLSIWHDSNERVVQRRVFFLGCLLTICGMAAFTGAVPTREYGHDIFTMLDNGWRIISGQRPHVDYTSAWGPVTFLITALGLKLSHYTVDGIGYGSAVFGLLIGLWSYGVSRGRMESSPRILLSLLLAALVVAPFPLGSSPLISSHAMVYNRYGYALLGLIMLEAFQPFGGARGKPGSWLGGISSGAAAALCLFLKASFFLISLLLLGASLLLWSRTRQRLLGLAFGFVSVTLVFLAYLGFDIQAVIGDLRMAAGAKSQSLSAYGLIALAVFNSLHLLGVLLLALAGSLAVGAVSPRWLDFRLLFLGALTFTVDLLARFTSCQGDATPMAAVFALMVMNTITARQIKLPDAAACVTRPYYAAMLSLGGLLLLPQLTSDLGGIAYGVWKKARPYNLAQVTRFTEPRLAPLLLYDGATPGSNGTIYTTYVNDGAALLRRVSGPGETVITMDMTNPFSYALGRKPALGGIAAAAYGNTLSDTHRPSDDAYFGNADIAMVPKHPALDDGLYVSYEAALNKRFRLAAETGWWRLYRRK